MRGMRRMGWVAMAAACLLTVAAAVAQEGAVSRAAPAAATQDESAHITLLDLLRMGGPLMYPLYLCSVLVVAFGIERAINLREGRIFPPSVVNRVRAATFLPGSSMDPHRLLADLQSENCPVARVIRAGLKRVDHPLPELEKAIEDAGAREADILRRPCRVLSITASLSPLLGLLGTVFGMIQAFMTVAAREEALGRTELLAAGIYQAMVTTAAGLCIAIPALVLYHIYIERIDRIVEQMDELATELVEKITAAV